MDWDVIVQWLQVLDSLSYYDLFRVGQNASPDDLKRAFYAFATDFHPDAHAGRPRQERDAIAHIFKRGNEAYRVLSNPPLRARYDEALSRGEVRPASVLSVAPGAEATASRPPKGADRMRQPTARPFIARAEELLQKGDPKQAKIQLVLAIHIDRGNPALESFLKEIEAEIARVNEDEKKKWRRSP
jgi:curved DNA-binding protein CbpA